MLREKSEKLIITFPTTTAAMAMEAACARNNVQGRLIPVPKEISAGCGLAWCSLPEQEQSVDALLTSESLACEGKYRVMMY